MNVSELLTHLSRIFFVVLAVRTLIDFLVYRDRIRRDIALVFLCLTSGILIGLFRAITGWALPWLSQVSTVALLAQPYLLLQLVSYFRPVPRLVMRGALAAMIVSWALVLVVGSPLPAWAVLAVIAYFVMIDGYAIMAFIRGAFASVGVVRQRLRFAAAGSIFLVAALVVAGIRSALPDLAANATSAIQFMAMLSALTYYVGFAPPRWLRQAWQLTELRDYLQQIQRSGDGSSTDILRQLYQAVTRAMGTHRVAVALWDQASEQLALQASDGIPSLPDLNLEGVIRRVWREQEAQVVSRSSSLDNADRHMMKALAAEPLLVVPITTGPRALGVLVVFLEHGSLFVEDDLRLLAVFTQQTAIVLANAAMLEELHRQTEALEEKVQQRTAALQRSNDELRRFAYVASHDLREPLRTVSNYLQLIEMRYADLLDDEGHEFFAFAVGGAKRMRDLIDALLAYSRVETQVHEFVPVDCQEVVDEVCQQLQVAIDEAGATIIHEGLPQIKADKQLILQLFQNLISNALKYRGDREPEIHIDATRHKKEWRFCVRDNGIGIEAQYLERIFVIFQRLHHQTEYPGTGIGLAICKKTVELHGGRMWVESQVGEGSTFYFTIPA
ncbi:MAG: GAF domain-containing protein [Anaerolineae bacterium]|nr:GAF domain-containing protein [Anaerolineae bacterium]